MAKLVSRISFEKNKAWMGWSGEVLIDEKGRDDSWIGRNFAYKPMVIKRKKEFFRGRFINVRVVRAFPTYLETEIVS